MKTDSVSDPSQRKPLLSRHREMLAAAILVFVAAFLLEVRPDERVAFRALSAFPLPPTCATKAWLNIDCPACGLTRSIIHLTRGDWAAATRAHRLGPIFAVALLVQLPYRLYGLRRHHPAPLGRLVPLLFGYSLIAALLGNWIYNQL
jgi:hypothetical protein